MTGLCWCHIRWEPWASPLERGVEYDKLRLLVVWQGAQILQFPHCQGVRGGI